MATHSPLTTNTALPEARGTGRREATFSLPFLFLLIYIGFTYARPEDYFPFFRLLHIPMILTLLLGAIWLLKADKTALRDPLVILFGVFIGLAALSVTFAVNGYWVYQSTKLLVLHLLIALVLLSFVRGAMLNRFIGLWLALHVFIAVKGMVMGGTYGRGFLGDENDLALTLNMAIPYAYFLSQSRNNSLAKRIFYLVAACILVLGVIMTYSRGGFVGLVAAIGGILMYSKNRVRNFLAVALLGGLLLLVVPQSYYKEIGTIEGGFQELGEDTRAARIYLWKRGWEMFLDNPVLGVGAGNFQWNVAKYELRTPEFDPRTFHLHGGTVSHSIYFTLIPEFGLVGTSVYIAMVVMLFVRLKRLGTTTEASNTNLSDEIPLMARATSASLLAFLAGGAFITVLYYPNFWYLLGVATALEYTARATTKEENTPQELARLR